MNVKKKLAALGLVGVMAMGQCMSAFAATTYTVSAPAVTGHSYSALTGVYAYQIYGTIAASDRSTYLYSQKSLEYKVAGDIYSNYYSVAAATVSNTKTNSYSSVATFKGNIGDKRTYTRCIQNAGYRTTKNGTNHLVKSTNASMK